MGQCTVLGNGESLAKILQFFEYVIPSDAILPNLPKGGSTESKIVLPCLQRLCHERSYNLYNKETAIEFHHLLVATMLCYARSLRRLRNAYENRREEESKNSQAEKEMAKRDAKIRKEEMKGSKAAFKRQRAQEADGFESAISALDEFVTLAGVEEERKEEEKQMGKSMLSENRTFKFPSKSVMNTTPSPSDKATFDIIDHAARENQTFKLPSESVTTPLPTDMTTFDIAIDRAARGVFITSRILNLLSWFPGCFNVILNSWWSSVSSQYRLTRTKGYFTYSRRRRIYRGNNLAGLKLARGCFGLIGRLGAASVATQNLDSETRRISLKRTLKGTKILL